MMLFFVAGIYLFARGIFAWYGQPIFYRKGTLENIDPDHLPQYLREEGVWNFLTGLVLVGKAILDKVFPGSMTLFIVFIVLLLVCVVFLAKCNEKYRKNNRNRKKPKNLFNLRGFFKRKQRKAEIFTIQKIPAFLFCQDFIRSVFF